MLNTIFKITNDSSSGFAYAAESISLWHGRLGHLNLASIRRLNKLNMIDAVNVNEFSNFHV